MKKMVNHDKDKDMPAARSGPKTADYHEDPQKDLRTCKSLHDRDPLENQCTILQL